MANSIEEMNIIKEFFLLKKAIKYQFLHEFFTDDDILNKPIKYLYKVLLAKLQLSENDIKYSTFKNGFRYHRNKLKNKNQ